jgi:hypothetical protein
MKNFQLLFEHPILDQATLRHPAQLTANVSVFVTSIQQIAIYKQMKGKQVPKKEDEQETKSVW